MKTPLALMIVCPSCARNNTLPGLTYEPKDMISCHHCGEVARLASCQVREIIPFQPFHPMEAPTGKKAV
jgi:hypothetical protein